MRALAAVLAERGWNITGSDVQPDSAAELINHGIRVSTGHSAGNISAETALVVFSEAIGPENAERRQAEALGIPQRSYAQLLGEITSVGKSAGTAAPAGVEPKRTLAVAGTHGKSTVTAMAAQILVLAGLDPTVVCGAAPVYAGSGIGEIGGRNGAGPLNLVEACEYRRNFLNLRPDVAVLLNVEHDHFDCYQTIDEVATAYSQFLALLPDDGLAIAAHEENTARGNLARTIVEASGRHTVTFGLSRSADWRATNLQQSRGRYRFDVVRHDRRFIHVVLSVPGKHNVLNALAAAALARHSGVSAQHVAQGLAAFRGLKRRLEHCGTWGGVPWIDDYAHHPTEIKASLATLRQMYPRRRIYCVFQPHQASRLTALLDELADSLHNADRIAVADVYRAREPALENGAVRSQTPNLNRPSGEATTGDLAARLRTGGSDVVDVHQPQAIARLLTDELQPGDLLVTIGAGDLGKSFHDIRERLRRNCAVA
jgi:UDP-N-acetylmuramate--alanine ligase